MARTIDLTWKTKNGNDQRSSKEKWQTEEKTCCLWRTEKLVVKVKLFTWRVTSTLTARENSIMARLETRTDRRNKPWIEKTTRVSYDKLSQIKREIRD